MKLLSLLLLVMLSGLEAAAQVAPVVNVVVDLSRVGLAAPPPSPAHPVYFRLQTSVYGGIGAIHVAQPPAAIARQLTAALSKEGFLPVPGGQRPDLLLSAIYGCVKPQIHFKGGADRHPDEFMNENLLLSLLVGDKAATLDNLTVREHLLDEIGRNKRHFLVVTAIDANSPLQGEPVVLWRARASMDGVKTYFYRAIPILIANGAPFFGRATPPCAIETAGLSDSGVAGKAVPVSRTPGT